MATSIINTLEGYYTLTFTGAQVQSLLNYVNSLSSDDTEEKIANSFVGLDSSTTSTHAHIIAETNEGNEVTTAIPPATTTNAGVMTAADKVKLNGSASNETLEILAGNFEERLTGTSASSSAYTDPHLFVSSVTTWAGLNSYLNAIGNSGQIDEKNTGWLEFHINGVPIKVLCQVQGYGNKVWSQMAFGQIKVEGGSLAQDYALPQIYIRNRDANGWKAWQNIIDIQDATTSKSGLMSAADKTALNNAATLDQLKGIGVSANTFLFRALPDSLDGANAVLNAIGDTTDLDTDTLGMMRFSAGGSLHFVFNFQINAGQQRYAQLYIGTLIGGDDGLTWGGTVGIRKRTRDASGWTRWQDL